MSVRKLILILSLLFLMFASKSHSIEVSSLKAEKRLEFTELFPKRICNKIYNQSSFGAEQKLFEDVTLRKYFNLKRINLNEENSNLTLFFDERSFFYKEPKLNIIIFNNLSDDFSSEMAVINKKIIEAKSQKIVVCEYDLKKSISEGKFFDFQIFEFSKKKKPF